MCGTKLTTAERSTMYGGTILEQSNGVCKYYALNIYVYKLILCSHGVYTCNIRIKKKKFFYVNIKKIYI